MGHGGEARLALAQRPCGSELDAPASTPSGRPSPHPRALDAWRRQSTTDTYIGSRLPRARFQDLQEAHDDLQETMRLWQAMASHPAQCGAASTHMGFSRRLSQFNYLAGDIGACALFPKRMKLIGTVY
jgi:hypothetical protein